MKKIFMLLIAFFSLQIGETQPFFFEKKFGGPSSDVGYSLKQISSGSIFISGYSSSGSLGGIDMALSKLSPKGDLIWQKFYGTSGNDYALFLNTTRKGQLVFCGTMPDSANNTDAVIICTDTSGNIQWQYKYSTAFNESLKYIEETSDSGFIACGFANDIFGSNDILVIRLDKYGKLLFVKMYGTPDNDYSDMVHELPGGDLIITADTKGKGAGGYDVELIRTDPVGNVIWDKTYGNSLANGCQGVLVTDNGKFLSYGETEPGFGKPYNFLLEMVDDTGKSVWRITPGGGGADAIFSLKPTPDHGYIYTGYSNSNSEGSLPDDIVLVKCDSNGATQWQKYFGNNGIDIGYEMIRNVWNNGYLLTAKYYDQDDQFYLLSVNDSGNIAPTLIINKVTNNPSFSFISINRTLKFVPALPAQSFQWSVLDLSGKILLKGEAIGELIEPVEIYQSGIYIFKAIGQEINFHSKFVFTK